MGDRTRRAVFHLRSFCALFTVYQFVRCARVSRWRPAMCCCVTHGIVCSLVSWMGAKQLLRVPHAFNMMLIAFAFRPKVRIYAPRCSSHGEAPDCFIARSDWFISTRCDPSAPLSFCPLACFCNLFFCLCQQNSPQRLFKQVVG